MQVSYCLMILQQVMHAQCANSQSMQWHYVTGLQYRTASMKCLAGLSHTLILSVCLERSLLVRICVYHNGQEHVSCKHAARGRCKDVRKGDCQEQAIELREVTWS